MVEMISTTTGAKGQNVDLHPYCCSKIDVFCALIAARKRNDVKAMMDQLMKNEALVIEINQLRTSSPFAIPSQQPFMQQGSPKGEGLPLRLI